VTATVAAVEEEENPWHVKSRHVMIVDVLVLPLPPQQKKTTTMTMITVNDIAVAVECRSTLQGSINDSAEGEEGKHPCCCC